MSSSEREKMLLHYRLGNKIGSGGMGEVYQAEDTRLGRTVAIKLLPTSLNENQAAKRRFLKEAQSASAFNHPNIVTIHAIEESDGLDFIVMEYIEGRTLKALIQSDGALSLTELFEIGIQVADALAAAHEIGLIHRDVKSANILMTPRGRAKVLDFGLAKMVRTIADGGDNEAPTLMNLTDEGTVLGTVNYMSPEQTRGELLDSRSDLFSFGCVLYEAATRSLPFAGPSMLAIMHAIATADPTATQPAATGVATRIRSDHRARARQGQRPALFLGSGDGPGATNFAHERDQRLVRHPDRLRQRSD